jgi:hypothetical protein
LLVTLTLYPGGIGQQLLPYRRWMSGGRLFEDRHEALEVPLQMGLLALLASLILGVAIVPAAIVGLMAGAVCTGLAISHVNRNRPDLKRHRRGRRAPAETEEEEPAEVEEPIFDRGPDGGEAADADGESTTRITAVSDRRPEPAAGGRDDGHGDGPPAEAPPEGSAEVAEPERDPQTDPTTRIPAVSGPPGPAGRGLRGFRRRKGAP